jgi:polyphosphate kinase
MLSFNETISKFAANLKQVDENKSKYSILRAPRELNSPKVTPETRKTTTTPSSLELLEDKIHALLSPIFKKR